MTQYSTDSRTRKYVKVCGFLSFAREYENQILDKGLDASKKVAHRGSEFIGNKIVDAVTTMKYYTLLVQINLLLIC